MRQLILLTLLPLVLSSCATPGSLRHDLPIFSLSVQRPASVVVSCIVEKWGDDHLPINMNVLPLPDGGSSVSILGGAQNTLLLVDVHKDGEAARVEAFRYGLMLDPFIAEARSCSS